MSEKISYVIRQEQPDDIDSIALLITAAFHNRTYSNGREAAIVEALRKNKRLTLSLVAISQNEVIGHAAVSPVTIDGSHLEWYGLGPLAVTPQRQRQGVGSALLREGLRRLEQAGAKGSVLLGDPAFYNRFGFESYPGLRYDKAPAEYFMALPLNSGNIPEGKVEFHESFSA